MISCVIHNPRKKSQNLKCRRGGPPAASQETESTTMKSEELPPQKIKEGTRKWTRLFILQMLPNRQIFLVSCQRPIDHTLFYWQPMFFLIFFVGFRGQTRPDYVIIRISMWILPQFGRFVLLPSSKSSCKQGSFLIT